MANLGWKVVCGKKSFRPATEYALQRVRYRLGSWTHQEVSDHGPFALFEELSQARAFAQRYGDAILLVEYKESDEESLWKKKPPIFAKSHFRGGRGYYAQSDGITEKTDGFPDGTLFARAVKPLALVAPEDTEEELLAPYLEVEVETPAMGPVLAMAR